MAEKFPEYTEELAREVAEDINAIRQDLENISTGQGNAANRRLSNIVNDLDETEKDEIQQKTGLYFDRRTAKPYQKYLSKLNG